MTRQKFDLSLLPPAPDLSFEERLWEAGLARVAGIDEAGRGAWAGPVAAAVVILPCRMELITVLSGVRDSKQMSAHARETKAVKIREYALDWGVGMASAVEIDELGILPATRLAVTRALEELVSPPETLLIDYLVLPGCPVPQTPLIKGDCRSLSIAAASVLAKTARDGVMRALDRDWPGYGFAAHKGYGTARHRLALEQMGSSPVHRRSFAPMRGIRNSGHG